MWLISYKHIWLFLAAVWAFFGFKWGDWMLGLHIYGCCLDIMIAWLLVSNALGCWVIRCCVWLLTCDCCFCFANISNLLCCCYANAAMLIYLATAMLICFASVLLICLATALLLIYFWFFAAAIILWSRAEYNLMQDYFLMCFCFNGKYKGGVSLFVWLLICDFYLSSYAADFCCLAIGIWILIQAAPSCCVLFAGCVQAAVTILLCTLLICCCPNSTKQLLFGLCCDDSCPLVMVSEVAFSYCLCYCLVKGCYCIYKLPSFCFTSAILLLSTIFVLCHFDELLMLSSKSADGLKIQNFGAVIIKRKELLQRWYLALDIKMFRCFQRCIISSKSLGVLKRSKMLDRGMSFIVVINRYVIERTRLYFVRYWLFPKHVLGQHFVLGV